LNRMTPADPSLPPLELPMSPIGLRVGPFEIIEEAHVPAHGSWFLARRAGLSRREPGTVLVRLLGPSPSARQLGELQRQFDALRAIDDRRIPRPVALYEGCGALAVHAPQGAPLSRVVEARLLSDVEMTPSTLMDLALEITEALVAAHERGCVHGHLSPETVALSPDGALWLWGFGNPDARPSFSWLPPERARGDRATAATDQWSLGALIVALVSGQTPWSSSSAAADPRSGDLGDFIEPVASQWPALGRLVRRMVDPAAEQRYPSLHPVRLELLGLARRAGGVSSRRELSAWLQRTWNLENGVGEPSLGLHRADLGPSVGPLSVEVEIDDEPALGPDASTREPARASAHRQPPAREPVALRAPAQAVVRPTASVSPRPAAATIVFEDPASDIDDDHLSTEMADEHLNTEMADEHLNTEMAEDWIPTEMAGVEPDLPQAPPVRATASTRMPRPHRTAPAATSSAATASATTAPAATSPTAPTEPVAPERVARPSLSPITIQLTDEQPAGLPSAESPDALTPSEPPVWREEPAPTLPGMEAPEPARLTVKPAAVAVAVQLDDDDAEEIGPDDLDIEIELLADEDQTGPVWQRTPAPTSIQPFTDPHFGGPGVADTPAPPNARDHAPGFAPDDAEPALHHRGAEIPSLDPSDPFIAESGPRPLPWELDPPAELPEPANDPIVRLAPWLATAASAGLVLLTVFNVVRGW